jgi:hypothetical protein
LQAPDLWFNPRVFIFFDQIFTFHFPSRPSLQEKIQVYRIYFNQPAKLDILISMGYILATIILWGIFLRAVPFSEWRKYYPALVFTALLGTVSDLLGVVTHQWVYHGPTVGGISLWSDLGIAPAEGGIFIRFFPKLRAIPIQILYWVFWAVANGLNEWIFVKLGWIGYDHWNPVRATGFYLFFFCFVWAQEYWYNGTGRLR